MPNRDSVFDIHMVREEAGSMKETIGASLLGVALAVFGATIALGAEQPHWGYAGDVDPQHWAALSPAYEMCGRGRNQSPIDLTGLVGADLKPIRFRYETNAQEIYNTGHSVQANYTPGSTIELDGHVFELKQFHFHAPSENRIGGKAFPLEGHLVHADRSSNLTVVAVMFVEGKANAIVAALWKQIPATAAEKSTLAPQVNAAGLLPGSRAYYRYNGSLTTPPCSEGVRWLVMKEPVSVSREQVEAFKKVMGHPNNRPVQPINARSILQPRSK
jgi:carbonic anhydrase